MGEPERLVLTFWNGVREEGAGMVNKENVKESVKLLVTKYANLISQNKIKSYDEERTKNELIEPLFGALGWDMRNQQNEEEVIKEQRVLRKKADYAFRLGGVIRFFVEAKAAKENLDNPEFARQAISYGFNKGVTWAVLTDFEGLKVFNCEWDERNIWRNQVFELKWTQYLSDFDKLWLLSKESFLGNCLASYAGTIGKRTPRKNVSELLLEQLLIWRQRLSAEIKKQKPAYSPEDIDEIVQRLIDRLIFIRACEDRGIEEIMLWEALSSYKSGGKSLSLSLQKIFWHYKLYYDSKLFGIKVDDTHEADIIRIEDRVLLGVIVTLYYSADSNIRYDFSIIDADILGNVYEQYLGTLLKTTAKRAKLEEGEVHRKSQGIYYTPTYIVDFIVKNTVGELLKSKKPSEIENIKILDPACGSGSFLIKTFDVLEGYFAKREGKESQTTLDEAGRVTRKIKILQNNLYGVDLDEKAVEIAQLNILLKMAEKRHRLPTLEKNIQLGNSLIDDSTIAGDKAFKWEERFNEIIANGGFDVVVGNPPYVQLSMDTELSVKIKPYLLNRFNSSMGRLNTFGFFIKLGIDILKEGGKLGFIVPNTILTQDYYEELRNMIMQSCKIESIVSFTDLPFNDAVVENVIFILEKAKLPKKRENNEVRIFSVNALFEFVKQKSIKQDQFRNNRKESFNIFTDIGAELIKTKIEKCSQPLKSFFEINQAIALKYDRAKYLGFEKVNKSYHPVIDGRHINRYSLNWDGNYLHYDINAIHSCKREDIFLSSEKLFFRRVGVRLIATLDINQFYALNTLIVMNKKENIPINIRYFLGLFNSHLINYYYLKFLKSTKQVFSEVQARQVKEIPIKLSDKIVEKSIIQLVDRMLFLNKQLQALGDKKTASTAKLIEERNRTDQEIDELVYKLYGLTKEEIKIIEESVK